MVLSLRPGAQSKVRLMKLGLVLDSASCYFTVTVSLPVHDQKPLKYGILSTILFLYKVCFVWNYML